MEQKADMPIEKIYYLKGNWRHVFWPLIVFLSLNDIISNAIINFFRQFAVDGIFSIQYLFMVIAQGLFFTCLWVFFYLAYGLNNRVDLFKKLFVIRAGLKILMLFEAVHINLLSHILHNDYQSLPPVFSQIFRITAMAVVLYDIAFFILISRDKHSSVLLRTSAMICAVLVFISFVYLFGNSYFVHIFSNIFDGCTYSIVKKVIRQLGIITGIVRDILFFGALSFSRMRE